MPEFSLVLRGYDPRQVDELVAHVEGTLGRGPLPGRPMTLKQLSWSAFEVVMRGYDRFEVDGALRRYRRELAELEGVELPDDEPDGGLDLVLGGPPRGTPALPAELEREIGGFALRWRGYDQRQVAWLLLRIWVALGLTTQDLDPPEPEQLADPDFDVVLRGYDMAAVDEALARYRRRLVAGD